MGTVQCNKAEVSRKLENPPRNPRFTRSRRVIATNKKGPSHSRNMTGSPLCSSLIGKVTWQKLTCLSVSLLSLHDQAPLKTNSLVTCNKSFFYFEKGCVRFMNWIMKAKWISNLGSFESLVLSWVCLERFCMMSNGFCQ